MSHVVRDTVIDTVGQKEKYLIDTRHGADKGSESMSTKGHLILTRHYRLVHRMCPK